MCKKAVQKDKQLAFKTNYRLKQVKSITRRGAICNTFDLHEATLCHKDLCLSICEWPFYTVYTVHHTA